MNSRILAGLAVVAASFMGSGCTSQSSAVLDRKEKEAPLAEAPLGSRIKKRNNAAPISGTHREDLEQSRAQAGIVATGIVNGN
jgi:hypothetical protein